MQVSAKHLEDFAHNRGTTAAQTRMVPPFTPIHFKQRIKEKGRVRVFSLFSYKEFILNALEIEEENPPQKRKIYFVISFHFHCMFFCPLKRITAL